MYVDIMIYLFDKKHIRFGDNSRIKLIINL